MSKKIGIVTLYKDNFGSILQAYSTYTYLTGLGYKCEILEEKRKSSALSKIRRIPVFLFKSIRYKEFFPDFIKIKRSSKKDLSLLSTVTRGFMDDFINMNFTVTCFDLDNSIENIDDYDYFITGSDQVWKGYCPFAFLEFVERKKRIAFAPSFGSNVKEYDKTNIKRGLMGFDNISTREETGVRIIKELLGKDAVRLADPTLLMSKSEWSDFSKKGMQKENYVLIHFLNTPNETAIKTINGYLKNNISVAYCICNSYEEYHKLDRYEFIDISPYDYVAMIKNAKFIFTDSFHSTLFSLNLETQFLTFERQYLHGNSQSSRIIDLLNRVDMVNRYIDRYREINFDELSSWDSNSLFCVERNNLKGYLQKALNIQI